MEPIVLAWRRAGKLGSCRISLKRRLRNQASLSLSFFAPRQSAAIISLYYRAITAIVGGAPSRRNRRVRRGAVSARCSAYIPSAEFVRRMRRLYIVWHDNGFTICLSYYLSISANSCLCNKAAGVLRSYRALRL